MAVCYCCGAVTKPETDFAEDDRDIVRRAAWLLGGHAPGREQPPRDQDLAPIYRAVGEHGFLKPLAHFAMVRDTDAVRATGAPRPGRKEAMPRLAPRL